MVLPVVTAMIIAVSALIPYIIYKNKEAYDRELSRRLRWVELLQRFSDELYNHAAAVDLFLEIQQAVLSRPPSGGAFPGLGIQPESDPDRTAILARLLETVNRVGLMIRLQLVNDRDVARSSIAYVALILWEHDEVKEYVSDLSKQHVRLDHPEGAFPEIEGLVKLLKNMQGPYDSAGEVLRPLPA